MQLITRIRVEGFRSLVDTTVEPLGNLTCLIGVNNSGKSNILRALSLFFTGEPEPGVPLSSQDYHANPKSKKRKQIRVSISFNLPHLFKFRRDLDEVKKELGTKFIIRKTWRLDQPEPLTEVAKDDGGFSSFKTIKTAVVKQFTDLINFRYIQNRTIPAQVLRAESPAFQDYVKRRLWLRLHKEKADANSVVEIIQKIASEVVSPANKNLVGSVDSIKKLEMATPLNIASLVKVSGFRAEIPTGARVSDDFWGAGTQAYAMFQLLNIIDTDFSRYFGWRQAAIWAIEEPESSLHNDLEQQLAIALRKWSDDDKLRMQILTTTHSETFVTAASEAFLVKLDNNAGYTTTKHKKIPDLVYCAATMGISRPVEPILCFLLNPVVLVEGSLDRRVLEYVAQQTRTATNCRFLPLPELDPMETGGGADRIVQYLKRHRQLIPNRPVEAPLVVLFDWDVDNAKLAKAREYYGDHADLRVMRMDASYADPKISPDIKGIERFYPVELFDAAKNANKLDVAIDQHGNISVETEKLKAAKSELADMLCEATDNKWYQHLQEVLEDVQKASSTLPGDQMKLHT